MGRDMKPHELLSVIGSVLRQCPNQSPDDFDIMRPLMQIQRAVALWVRSTLRTYGNVLHHEVDEVVFGPDNNPRQPPHVQHFVYDTVCLSAQSLFWESVRRSLLDSEQDKRTVRCICECLCCYEQEARVSRQIMSGYVDDLFGMSQQELETVLPPYAEDICQIPWLRLELFEVMSLSFRFHEVRQSRAAAFNAEIAALSAEVREIMRQARPFGAYGAEAGQAPEVIRENRAG